MYTNTAYEALYQLMGLRLQEEVTHALTSATVFRAVLLLLFAVSVFTFMVHFASRSMPFFLTVRRAPLSRLGALFIGLFVGISILKVGGASVGSRNIAGKSWSDNPYIRSHDPQAADEYQVSWLFRLASGSAEEIARFLGIVVDRAFQRTNSQMSAPNYFYKAVLGAASDSIGDPTLRREIDYFTEECLSKVLPTFNPDSQYGFLDRVFGVRSPADQKLASIRIEGEMGPEATCLELKRSVNLALTQYADSKSEIYNQVRFTAPNNGMYGESYRNLVTSSLLVNHYLGEHEGTLGLEKGTELPGTGGRIFQYLNRFFSMEGFMSAVGLRSLKGASVAAERSQRLSDHLARAPHVAGFIKMLLVAFFPVLAFFLAAGKFRPLAWWWLTYLSVCLWTPLWALLYHVITTLALNLEVLNAFGQMSDGISLYSASLISSRLYQAFAVYAWLQLLVGPALSGSLLYFLRPALSDASPDSMPGAADKIRRAATLVPGPVGKAAGALGVLR